MIVLLLVALSVATGYRYGGKLRALSETRLEYTSIIFIAIALQLTMLLIALGSDAMSSTLGISIYFASYFMVLIFLLLNDHIKRLQLVTVGLMLNLAAILTSGGYMPVTPLSTGVAIATDKPLWLLHDIFSVPYTTLPGTVFSVGDVLIAVGMFMVIRDMMLGQAEREVPIHQALQTYKPKHLISTNEKRFYDLG